MYQASTKEQTALLYECVSSRAKGAIGMEATTLDLKPGEPADLVLFGAAERTGAGGRALQKSCTILDTRGQPSKVEG